MQSNPIQQRIELIADKWNELKTKQKESRVIHIQSQDDETDMVSNFYTYMLASDTPVLDISFLFDSACTDSKTYSQHLLKELEETILIWNESEKPEGIDFVPVDWKPDYSLQNEKNPAALFISNFNRLANSFDLQEGIFAVAILDSAVKDKNLVLWLENALEYGINASVKILVNNTVSKPVFGPLPMKYKLAVETLPINLNMPKAMEQCAAMGDPKDPATPYRTSFTKMMNAMGAGKEAEAEKWGMDCLKIATDHIKKDPYWIIQVVVIYIALGNDKIRYKNTQAALILAKSAVETAETAQSYFENGAAVMLLAQAQMFQGTVAFLDKNWDLAYESFSQAFALYQKQGNIHLAIEASRMAGKSGLKFENQVRGISILAEGARLGKKIDTETALSTTYMALLEQLIDTNHSRILPVEELEEIAGRLFGPQWRKNVANWKKPPEMENINEQEKETVTT